MKYFDRAIEWTMIGIAIWAVVGAVQVIGEIGRVFHG